MKSKRKNLTLLLIFFQIIINYGASALPFSNKMIVIQKSYKIGQQEGDDNYVFALIGDFDVDNEGNIYVLDSKNYHVKKFSDAGKYITTFGREGKGPGEFSYPTAITVIDNIGVAVLDPPLSRITFFNFKGQYIKDFKIKQPSLYAEDFSRFLTSNILVKYKIPNYKNNSSTICFMQYDIDGKAEKELIKIERDAPPKAYYTMNKDVLKKFDYKKWDFAYYWCINSKGYIFIVERKYVYEIIIFSPDGKLHTTISRQFEIITKTEAEVAQEIELIDLQSLRLFGTKFGETGIPKIKPAIANIFLDDLDRLWVETNNKNHSGGILFDIYDDKNNYIAEVNLSEKNISRFKIKNDNFYGIQKDELGAQYIVKFKIMEEE